MRTSRLKNIVIVILLLVNVFLLVPAAQSPRRGARLRTSAASSSSATLFERSGVTFDRTLLPDEVSSPLSLSL